MDVDIHQFERILDEIKLYLVIEGRIGGEAGRVVDLQQDGLSRTIQHDVQTQYVEAHIPGIVLRLAAAILMGHEGQAADDRFYRHVIDLLLQYSNVHSCLLQLLKDTSYRPFVAHSHVIATIVEDEFGVVLVDRVVGQVDVLLLQVGSRRLEVGLSRQTGQALFVHV